MSTDENKLIEENINMAYDISWKYYNKFQRKIDIDELQSICLLGLTKAVKTYKSNLKFTFSTYAYKCMINEILLYYRNNSKHLNLISIYAEIGDKIELCDTISDDLLLDEYLEKLINLEKLNQYINKLENRLQRIVKLKLKGLTMIQIGDIIGISQPQVSRDYQKALNILRNYYMKGDIQ